MKTRKYRKVLQLYMTPSTHGPLEEIEKLKLRVNLRKIVFRLLCWCLNRRMEKKTKWRKIVFQRPGKWNFKKKIDIYGTWVGSNRSFWWRLDRREKVQWVNDRPRERPRLRYKNHVEKWWKKRIQFAMVVATGRPKSRDIRLAPKGKKTFDFYIIITSKKISN